MEDNVDTLGDNSVKQGSLAYLGVITLCMNNDLPVHIITSLPSHF